MQLNENIARQIVERTMTIISYSINVMDEKGRIIGSGDSTRLQQKHEGAVLAINEKRTVEINHAVMNNLKGVKPGINLPIVYRNQVIGVIGISGAPEEVHHYGELVKMTAELIVEQAVLMSQIEWNKRHREELVLQLVQGSTLNDNQLNSIAERLDLDLSQPRIAVVVKVIPSDDTPMNLEHLQQLVHLLEYPERDNLVGILSVSEHEVIVLKPITLTANGWSKEIDMHWANQLLRRVKKQGRFKIRITLGDYFPSLQGIALSYQTAKRTMGLTKNQAGQVFVCQDYRIPVLLSAVKNEPWHLQQLCHPYQLLQLNDSKGTLIKTLNVYFKQNCDAHQTCRELHIHRNTLRYRLDRISKITSLDINNLDSIIQLYLGSSFIHLKNDSCADAQ
ncbi:sugar diacid recognition domain-containing protein [Vibrio sp. EA2]|uniref:sugar diacid recognition domain-containing protein n=1 Tax=Vibrio sp. EA2 TaxID=3079860 RepID=UPI0029494B23|nr:sugar diacid recognition domain-containing protein [Vibrio sp. EA2]MDV6251298.1 sugar diacid recognition domain-containing protein [Vibrio sp. EA2]